MNDDDYRSRLTFSYLVGVQSHIDEGISTLDGLIPMFAPILQQFAGEIFDANRVALSFSATYGSKIHPYAVASISKKLFEAGYLVMAGKEQKTNSIIYTVCTSIKVDSLVGETQVDKLFLSFREFANSQAASHSLPLFDNEELDRAFISRLQSFPLPDQRALRAYTESKAITGTLSLSKIAKFDDATILSERKAQWLNAIFSDYVINKIGSSSDEYDLFQRVATGSIVVEAVLNFSDPKTEKNLKNTWFIVDTPLLMDLLDLDSPERNLFAKELFAQLKKANAKLAVFSHSIVETSNNIKAALSAYSERNSHGAIGIRMISNFDFVRRIGTVNQNLREEVKQLGFTIYDTPSSTTSYSYLSTDLENQLSNNIGFYNKDVARLRDASSIAGVVRLRGNHKSARQDFSSTKYIFVTRNSRLAQLSENYLLAQKVYEPDEMPAAVTDSSLAAVLWLMFGSSEVSNLPYKRLLANCTAIPQTDQHVRERVLNLISDENSELSKSFQIWSRTPRGAEVMLRKSLADPNLVTLDNIAEFIDAVKTAAGSDAAEELKVEMEKEVEKMRLEHERTNFAHELEKSNIRESLNANSAELERVKSQLEKNSSDNAASINNINLQFVKLQNDLEQAEKQRQVDRENIIGALVGRFPAIQRKWDIILALLVGAIAAVLGISGLVFDKYYTISTYWDLKVLIAIYVGTGLLTVCAFGSMPTHLFQKFINGRKRQFITSQLSLIGEVSLMERYVIDYKNNVAERVG